MRKVLPQLQQVAFSILLETQGWKSVVVEKGTILPFKRMTVRSRRESNAQEGKVESETPVTDVSLLYEANGEEKKCGESLPLCHLICRLHFSTDLCGKRLLINCNGEQLSGIRIALFVFDGSEHMFTPLHVDKEVEKKELCIRDE